MIGCSGCIGGVDGGVACNSDFCLRISWIRDMKFVQKLFKICKCLKMYFCLFFVLFCFYLVYLVIVCCFTLRSFVVACIVCCFVFNNM